MEEKLDNRNNFPVTDRFEFYIPETALLSDFSITIDGKEYRADILKKAEAQQEYEKTVSSDKTPFLPEMEGYKILSCPLNFEANQSIIVRLTYEQALTRNQDKYEYLQYPRSNHYATNNLSVSVDISSSADILNVETPAFETDVWYPDTKSAQVRYVSHDFPGEEMKIIFRTENTPLTGNMLFYKDGDLGYFMHTFSPTAGELETDTSTPLLSDVMSSYNVPVSQTVCSGEKDLVAGSEMVTSGMYDPGIKTITSRITGNTTDGKRVFEHEFAVQPKENNDFVAKLWAYNTIINRIDRTKMEGETDELVPEVVNLSLEYGFVTPYTSLFVEKPDAEVVEIYQIQSPKDGVGESQPDEPVSMNGADGFNDEETDDSIPIEEPVEESEETEQPAGNPAPGFGLHFAVLGLFVAGSIIRNKLT